MKDTALTQKTQQNSVQALTEVSYEELLTKRERLSHTKEEIEAALSEISFILLDRLNEEKVHGKIIGEWSLSKATRYSFTTPLDKAKEIGAIKETIDQTKLKAAFQKGIIPESEVKRTEYLLVRLIEKNTESEL